MATAENLLRPLHQEPADPLQPPASPRPGLVFLIEDDKSVREMLRRFLLFAGFEVLVAAGGREGLLLLPNEPRIAVVMLDLNMPCMDGRQVRAAQLATNRFARIPTVILTGLQLTQADCDELQASDYLAKPVDLDRLIWNDLSSQLVLRWHSHAASVAVEAAIATVDHSDIRGSKPHNRDPSGATSD